MGLLELAERLRRRQLSPVEVTHAQLARIAALEPKLMAFETIKVHRAIAQAKVAEAEI
jgi:Asp-tRNA(Asn)/Glu-tRNA(Gln) amidotransferase A subunit family amidase